METLIIEVSLDQLHEVELPTLLNKQNVTIVVEKSKTLTEYFCFVWNDLDEGYYIDLNGRLPVGPSVEYFLSMVKAYYS